MSQIKQYGKVAITFEGEFDQNKSYERLCIVEYAGMSFLSKVDGTTSIPTQNKDEWLQLSVPGPQGPVGERGEQGLRGEKGDYGAKGISTRTIFVYKHSETLPDRPQGGSVDFIGGAITYPEGWGKSDNIPAPIWRSERTFFEDDSLKDEWSVPMKMSGDDGKPGVDGVNMEFIYKVTKRPTIVPDISNMPSENVDDYVPVEFGWSDSPNGVTPTNRIEWVCTRKKVNGVWTAWEGPTIWSAYGEKGQDGDGVEYIFYLENTGYPPENPTPDDWEYNDDYQNVEKEYVPTDLGWTDVATGISEENKFEWQCVRKFRNGFWQPFEGPYLWSRYGDKGNIGDRILEMFAETEDHNPPHVVKDNINPGSIWSIAPPVAFDPSKGGAIWSIYTYIDYKNEFVEYEITENGETIKVLGWSNPIIKTGYNGEDGINPNYRTYIYKKSDEKPELPTFTDPTEFEEAGWKDAPYDDVDEDGSVDIKGRWWECSGLVNGESGEVEWQYIREINGSNSKALFQVTNNRVQPDCNKTNNNPGDLWKETYNIPNIYQYVWMITGEFDTQGNLIGEWQGPTCITGETPKIEENGNITIGGEDTGVNVLNLHLELDNDSETIPTDSDGNPTNTVSAITTAQLYNGSKLITEGVSYSAEGINCTLKEITNSTGIFEVITLKSGKESTGYYVNITANYKNKSINKKFNINKSLGEPVYKIILSKNIVTATIQNLTIDVKIIKVDSNTIVNKLTENGLSFYVNNEDKTTDYENYMYNVGKYPQSYNSKNITFDLKKGNNIIESETLGVVKDGADGVPPKIIKGYWYIYNNETGEYESTDVLAEGKTVVVSPRYKLVCDCTEIIPEQLGYFTIGDTTVPVTIGIMNPDREPLRVRLFDGENNIPINSNNAKLSIDENLFYYTYNPENIYNIDDYTLGIKFGLTTQSDLTESNYKTLLKNGFNITININHEGYVISTTIKVILSKIDETDYSIWFNDRVVNNDLLGASYPVYTIVGLITIGELGEQFRYNKYVSNEFEMYLGSTSNYKAIKLKYLSLGVYEVPYSVMTKENIYISAYIDDVLVARSNFYNVTDSYVQYYFHTAYSNNSDGEGYQRYLTDAKYIGVYTGTKVDFNDLVKTDFTWSLFRGYDGAKGLSGIPGVSLYLRYWYGNSINISSDAPSNKASWYNDPNDVKTNNDYPYIWFVQGEKIYTRQGETNTFAETILWTTPALLSGVTELDKIKDKVNRRIIYPNGLYGAKSSYVCTDTKAPYVLDSLDGNYYIYLKTNIWNVADQTLRPSTDYSNNKPLGTNSWEKFEIFEAIYSGIGVFGNALVGSAVFNGNYMFSQQGVDKNGNPNNDYENFNPENPFDENNNFYPNVCINFKKGIFSLGKNKLFELSEDGSLNIGNFKWDNKGNSLPNKLDTTIQLTSEDTSYTPSLHQNENLYLGIAGVNTFTLNLPNFLNIDNMIGKDGYLCSVILYNYQAFISSGSNSNISVTIKTGFFSLNNEQEIVYNIKPGRYVTIHYYKFNKNINNICALLPSLNIN